MKVNLEFQFLIGKVKIAIKYPKAMWDMMFQFLIGKVKITCPGHIASPKYSFNSS